MAVLQSQKEVAVITRSTYYQGGREAGFHCLEKYLQLQHTVSILELDLLDQRLHGIVR